MLSRARRRRLRLVPLLTICLLSRLTTSFAPSCLLPSKSGLSGTQTHDDVFLTRRRIASDILTAFSWLALPTVANPEESTEAALQPNRITVPLEYTGQELLIFYRVDGSLFRAVLDTGSPFLMIPGSCGANTRYKSGCYREQGVPSGLADTFEQFDGFEGNVEWRSAPVTLVNATGSLFSKSPTITFGVASESLLAGPGGVFFGLIRDTDDWIRPSFLGQTMVESWKLDLRHESKKTLTLSQDPLIPETKLDSTIRLTSDLRRRFGDPVSHYVARACSLTVNSFPLAGDGVDGKPIYVILDTGVTGMVVSQDLFDKRYVEARQRREKNLWGNVQLSFRGSDGTLVCLAAEKPLTTAFDPRQTWKRFRGAHLVVVGLSFLNGNQVTVDINRKLLFLD